ncbi:MAG TPA: polysaccharide pyruvyl transferase family protein [Longimicrobium sp.]|nr:polysaccharide pyruvyl transferase family protein [Longimicrobium sp.]
MLIEVRGTGVGRVNKGAELMLRAIVRQRDVWGSGVELVMGPGGGPYRRRAQLGLYQKLWAGRLGPWAGELARMVPARVRHRYGLVTEAEIRGVLDASGFAYSDQWGPSAAEGLARLSGRWRRQGKRVVLLPQALGPFRDPDVRDAFRRALDAVDLVFARDRVSLEYARALGPSRARVEQAPDFTVSMPGTLPPGYEPRPGQVAVVPNLRMVDKGEADASDRYVAALAECVRHLRARGYEPFILVHDPTGDFVMAERLRERTGGELRVVHEDDPAHLKGILGSCHAVIASRFHALVSAMSQAVPSLAMGWSHKYEMLFEDFGADECVVNAADPAEKVLAQLDRLLQGAERERLVRALGENAVVMKENTTRMWDEVARVMGIGAGRAPARGAAAA